MRCANWSQSSLPSGGDAFRMPLFQKIDDKLVYVGGRYVPKYETVTEGFTSLKMITRNDASPKASSSNKTPTHPYLWDNSALIQSEGIKIKNNFFTNFIFMTVKLKVYSTKFTIVILDFKFALKN